MAEQEPTFEEHFREKSDAGIGLQHVLNVSGTSEEAGIQKHPYIEAFSQAYKNPAFETFWRLRNIVESDESLAKRPEYLAMEEVYYFWLYSTLTSEELNEDQINNILYINPGEDEYWVYAHQAECLGYLIDTFFDNNVIKNGSHHHKELRKGILTYVINKYIQENLVNASTFEIKVYKSKILKVFKRFSFEEVEFFPKKKANEIGTQLSEEVGYPEDEKKDVSNTAASAAVKKRRILEDLFRAGFLTPEDSRFVTQSVLEVLIHDHGFYNLLGNRGIGARNKDPLKYLINKGILTENYVNRATQVLIENKGRELVVSFNVLSENIDSVLKEFIREIKILGEKPFIQAVLACMEIDGFLEKSETWKKLERLHKHMQRFDNEARDYAIAKAIVSKVGVLSDNYANLVISAGIESGYLVDENRQSILDKMEICKSEMNRRRS